MCVQFVSSGTQSLLLNTGGWNYLQPMYVLVPELMHLCLLLPYCNLTTFMSRSSRWTRTNRVRVICDLSPSLCYSDGDWHWCQLNHFWSSHRCNFERRWLTFWRRDAVRCAGILKLTGEEETENKGLMKLCVDSWLQLCVSVCVCENTSKLISWMAGSFETPLATAAGKQTS